MTYVAVPGVDIPYDEAQGRFAHFRLGQDCLDGSESERRDIHGV